MIIVNTPNLPGSEVSEVLGVVRGNTVRARNVGRDIFAGLKSLVGGEISEYTQLMTDARDQSMKRMQEEAEALGADAILNIRFATAEVMQGTAEIMVYGTAVKLK